MTTFLRFALLAILVAGMTIGCKSDGEENGEAAKQGTTNGQPTPNGEAEQEMDPASAILTAAKAQPAPMVFALPPNPAVGQMWEYKIAGDKTMKEAIVDQRNGNFIVECAMELEGTTVVWAFEVDPNVKLQMPSQQGNMRQPNDGMRQPNDGMGQPNDGMRQPNGDMGQPNQQNQPQQMEMKRNVKAAWIGLPGTKPQPLRVAESVTMPQQGDMQPQNGDMPEQPEMGEKTMNIAGKEWMATWVKMREGTGWVAKGTMFVLKLESNGKAVKELTKWSDTGGKAKLQW